MQVASQCGEGRHSTVGEKIASHIQGEKLTSAVKEKGKFCRVGRLESP